mgnify:CR=1 FL=1
MCFLHVRFCSVSVRETELWLTCSVLFGQNSKTLLRSVTMTKGTTRCPLIMVKCHQSNEGLFHDVIIAFTSWYCSDFLFWLLHEKHPLCSTWRHRVLLAQDTWVLRPQDRCALWQQGSYVLWQQGTCAVWQHTGPPRLCPPPTCARPCQLAYALFHTCFISWWKVTFRVLIGATFCEEYLVIPVFSGIPSTPGLWIRMFPSLMYSLSLICIFLIIADISKV